LISGKDNNLSDNRQSKLKDFQWLTSFIVLMFFSILFYSVNRGIDHLLKAHNIEIFKSLFSSDIGNLTNILGGLGEVIAAVLGIEITAVAIIVQMAANKYSPKIMDLFVRNRVNVVVFTLFILTALNTVLVTQTIREDFIPYFSITVALSLTLLNLLIFVPHFIYVFNFMQPTVFLKNIEIEIFKVFNKLSRNKINYSVNLIENVKEDINFIGDIALNSIYQGDRAVILLCLNTLREISVLYLGVKKNLPPAWFERTGTEFKDPDFSSYSTFVMNNIEQRKILLERKIFRLYELVLQKSHVQLRDAAGGVLLNTELIAFEAIKYNDKGVLQVIFQYFNTYLRIAISDRSPRSAFNTLEHYRIVAEVLLESNPYEVEKISEYFKYYGQEANKNNVFFILETAAHDLCQINEIAFSRNVVNLIPLLQAFLNLDEPIENVESDETHKKEISLIGVRIAQVKLAGFYLLNNARNLARVIYTDMKIEPLRRIRKIKEIILKTLDQEFYEINSRGINFYYVSPERREALMEFFDWFEENDAQKD